MRQGPSNRRARGRGNNSGRRSNIPNRNQTFDSNGPDVRIRGTAFQVNEKYQALARDASGSGDRIMAENYFQHAEHYHRIIEAINEAQSQTQQQSEGRDGAHRHRDGGARDSGHRDNGHRDAGARDGANRDGAARENGHQADRDGARPAALPAGNAEAVDDETEVEFGKDPRQDDARDAASELPNGDAVVEVAGSQPEPEPEAAESKPAASGANGADAQADEAPAPKPRRRGPGRPRKSTKSKDSAAAPPEANTEGD